MFVYSQIACLNRIVLPDPSEEDDEEQEDGESETDTSEV